MMLLYTHVLVRYLTGDRKLGRKAVAVIDKALPDDEVFVSAISFWEIATLVERGRLQLDMTASAFRAVVLRHGIQEEPVRGDIGIAAAELARLHGDPADRLLVATAVLQGLTLLTADATLLGWKVRGLHTQDATA